MRIFYLIKKILKTIFFSLKFFLSFKNGEALLVSLPRSGTHLTFGLLNICYSMKLGYQGKLGIADSGYSAYAKLQMPFDERSIFHKYSKLNLWHSHLPFSKIVPQRKYFCKTLILIREPVEGIKSFVLHALNANEEETYLSSEISLQVFLKLNSKYNFINHYVSFLESWKNRKQKNLDQKIEIIDHKILKKNILGYLKFVNSFFRFEFSEEQMLKAVSELDINKISKASSIKSIRFSKNKINFSKEVDKFISDKCEKPYLEILKYSNNKITGD